MNTNRYRLVFNRTIGSLVPAAETARSRGKAPGTRRGATAGAALLALVSLPVAADHPAGLIPHSTIQWQNAGIDAANTNAQVMTIHQTQPRAILDWQQFNLERGQGVVFDQQGNASWSALNRIWDANPSTIAGSIRADGEIMLINRNGILFKDGAQLDTQSLFASTLDISNETFKNGLLSLPQGQAAFAWGGSAAQFRDSLIQIFPGAELVSKTNGRVVVLAPNVVNQGVIRTPEGQTILAAGAKVYLSAPTDSTLRGFLVEVDPYVGTDANGAPVNLGGSVRNDALGQINRLGQIIADRGNVTLAALAVNQSGRVRSTTTVNLNGSINIVGRDTAVEDGTAQTVIRNGVTVLQGKRPGQVVFGSGSVTEVLPDLANKSTTQDSQRFTRSLVEIAGRDIRLEDGAAIVAPSGDVRIVAQQGLLFQEPGQPAVDGVRVYVGSGSRIDVGGITDVGVAMERNFIEVQLRGNELRDSPLQRNGFLRGKTVIVDVRQGSTIGDVSGYLGQVARTVGERSTTGGSITVRSEGDVIARSDSVLDVSGGSVKYADGYGAATKLIGADGRIYDIGTASRDRLYVGFADQYQTFDANGKVDQQVDSVRSQQLQKGYVEGKSAGTIDLIGHAVVIDGTLDGSTVRGPLQRDLGALPVGGRLLVGDPTPGSFMLRDIAFVSQRHLLPAGFDADGDLDPSFANRLELDAGALSRGGFSRIVAYGNGLVSVGAGVTVQAGPGGSVTLNGRQIDVQGSIVAPGGAISLASREVPGELLGASEHRVEVGSRGRLLTRGLWTNDIVGTSAAAGSGAIALKGGSVSISSVSDVVLRAGSVVDVSGGAQFTSAGKLRTGDAGAISISTGRFGITNENEPQVSSLVLDGQLRAYSAAKGGSLTLATSFVTIGGSASGRTGELHLDPDAFSTGGFSSYAIFGQDGIDVAAGTRVQPNPQTWVFAANAVSRPTGVDPATAVALYRTLPWELRSPTNLSLTANNTGFGDVQVGQGATLAVDPGGHLSITAGGSITMLGRVEARAGAISIATIGPSIAAGFDPRQSIWFGANSVIDARGITRLQPNTNGVRVGDVLDGGTIEVRAQRGTLVTEAGSRMDASGIADVIDVRQTGLAGGFYQSTPVASSAGAVTLHALEGMLLDGSLRGAAGGVGASGGVLTIAMDRVASVPGFPLGPREIIVSAGGSFVPAGLQPGDAFDASLNGLAFVAVDRLRGSGFELLDLRAHGAIEFKGDVQIAAARGVELDAPVIRAGSAGAVRIDAPYVSLGSSDSTRRADGNPTSGPATLEVRARHIDLVGISDVRGFGTVDLASSGDVRLLPVIVATPVSGGGTTYSVEGRFLTGGDTTITAQQFYAASFGTYRLGIRPQPDAGTGVAADATLTINRAAGTAALPLSAGANLTLEATNIVNNGVVRVPFGRLAFEAGKTIELAAGSITSVSGAGLLVPFGKTELSGKDYVYNVGPTSQVQQLPPEKRLVLSAPDVDVKGDVDLRGGGDLYAYEFTTGPGGSRDVLDPAVSPTSFAILPTLGAAYAPYDVQYNAGIADVLPGERIRLKGLKTFGDNSRLSDGSYVVLPARYALLPGAFLVTPVANSNDFTASSSYSPSTGSQVVVGRHEHAVAPGGVVGQTRDTAFLVESGAEVRQKSEYAETTAGRFFATRPTAQLPGDAGALSIAASTRLALDGAIATLAEAGRRGAEIDIAAPKLAVVRAGNVAPAGFLGLDAQSLAGLKASSLLLGGTRTRTSTGVTITPGAIDSEVLIANGAEAPLTGPDVMLVAGKSITLAPGSIVRAEGTETAAAQPLRIVGGGAFVRASTGPMASLSRTGDLGTEGTLTLQTGIAAAPGASVSATGSLILDATRDTVVEGNSGFEAPAVSVASGRISFGSVPAGTAGLVVGDSLLARLGQVRDLTLRSYSSIDFHEAVALGSMETVGAGDSAITRPFTQRLVLDAPGIGHYGSGDVTLTAGQVIVRNSTPATGASPFANAPTGTGTLNMVARASTGWAGGDVRVDGGNVLVDGFDLVAMRADGQIVGSGAGELRSTGDLSLAARRVVAESNASQRFASDAALTVSALGAAMATPWEAVAGRLMFAGDTIDVTGRIEVPGGSIGLSAQRDVTLGAGAVLDASGRQRVFGVSTQTVSAGDVTLSSVEGDVVLGAGSLVNVRSAAAGGNAGKLVVAAKQGRFAYAGAIDGHAGTAARGGSISVDVAALDDTSGATTTDFGGLNRILNAGGVNESRSIRLRTGDLVHEAADAEVRAHTVTLSTDLGRIDLGGTIDASGAKGGAIAVWSASGIEVGPRASLDASGTDTTATGVGSAGRGGTITLGTTGTDAEDKLTFVTAGVDKPTFDVSGAGEARGGSVTFRVPRLGADVNAGAFAGTITGASGPIVEAYAVYSASTLSTSGTTVAGANLNISNTGTLYVDTRDYMTAASQNIIDRFGSGTRVRPGIEVRSDNDLTLASDWNLCGTQATCTGATAWRFGAAEPGVLTLRAGGNVLLNRTLSDGFNGVATNSVLQATDSWSYRIVAGADRAAANPMTVLPAAGATNGDILLAAARMVRSGTGSIDLAARRDVSFASTQSVIYTAGRPGAAVDGFVAPSIGTNTSSMGAGSPAPTFPDQGGDISIGAGRDIRAVMATQLVSEWLYRDAKRTNTVTLRPNPQTAWWVRFDQFQQGVGALAGGDVSLNAGGNVENVSAVIPTNGRLGGALNTAPDLANLVEQGGGDLSVQAAGDVKGGLFYVSKGSGVLDAGGSVTTRTGEGVVLANPILAVGDATFAVNGRDSVAVEGVFNPTALQQARLNTGTVGQVFTYAFTYADRSALKLSAARGDVVMSNDPAALPSTLFASNPSAKSGLFVYPSIVTATAYSGNVGVRNTMSLFPSKLGDFNLYADHSVSVANNVFMSDAAPTALPLVARPDTNITPLSNLLFTDSAPGAQYHTDPGLHADDRDRVEIIARNGNISGASGQRFGNFAKPVVLDAAGDIRDAWVVAQNQRASDRSVFRAGGDIVFSTLRDPVSGLQQRNSGQIVVGGPGELLVDAGRSIDLGNSSGIVTRGNLGNPFLPDQGAAIRLSAGGAPLGVSPFVQRYVEGVDDPLAISGADFLATMRTRTKDGSLYLDDAIARYKSDAAGRTQTLDILVAQLSSARAELRYRSDLLVYMRGLEGDTGFVTETARDRFEALPSEAQTGFVNHLLYAEVKAGGREALDGTNTTYARGYDAIGTLFPGSVTGGGTTRYARGTDFKGAGDISLFFSQVKTEQGGDIEMRVPNGLVNAGLANPGDLPKSASELGIVTVRGGTVRSFGSDDFLVNQSRVFTLQGGDVLVWSSWGNIDAGKGAKTSTATPPPQLVVTPDGRFVIDTSRSISGSGIGVLLGGENVVPGDVDLIAPTGAVDAGDAGIRVAGTLRVAALLFLNANNVSTPGGAITNASNVSVNVAGSVSVGNPAADAQKAIEKAQQQISDRANQPNNAFKPSFLTVEVIALGDDSPDSTKKR